MSWRPTALIVARTPSLGSTLFGWFSEAGYDVALVTTFAAARAQLRTEPDLLVSEIRLGEYNGLHLASRAHAHDIPAIVIGGRDPVLERDASQMGVMFVAQDVEREYLITAAERLIAGPGIVSEPPARLGVTPAKLSFVSSGELPPMNAGPWVVAAAAARRMH